MRTQLRMYTPDGNFFLSQKRFPVQRILYNTLGHLSILPCTKAIPHGRMGRMLQVGLGPADRYPFSKGFLLLEDAINRLDDGCSILRLDERAERVAFCKKFITGYSRKWSQSSGFGRSLQSGTK